MIYSRGYNPEYDMGADKEVIELAPVSRSSGTWVISYNGIVPGDSRGMPLDAANSRIKTMCNSLYCCVVYTSAEMGLPLPR